MAREAEVVVVRVGDIQVQRAEDGFDVFSRADRVFVSDAEVAALARVLTDWPGVGVAGDDRRKHEEQERAIGLHDNVVLFGWSPNRKADWIVRKSDGSALNVAAAMAARLDGDQ